MTIQQIKARASYYAAQLSPAQMLFLLLTPALCCFLARWEPHLGVIVTFYVAIWLAKNDLV